MDNISFSGGVFQNGVLVNLIRKKFSESEFQLFFNERVPPNDAGIALGQMYGYLLYTTKSPRKASQLGKHQHRDDFFRQGLVPDDRCD